MSREQAVQELLGSQTAATLETTDYKSWHKASEMINSPKTSFDWLVDGLLPKTGLVVFYGAPDSGKSTALRQLCLSIVAKTNWLGFKTNGTNLRAAFISTEDDKDALDVILKEQVNAMGYDKVHGDKLYFLFQAGDVLKELTTLLETSIANDDSWDIIIIDCFSDIFTLQANAANQVRVFLSSFHDLARTYETLIIFNHHSKKEAETRIPHKNNASGVGLVAKARVAIEFRKDPLEDYKRHLCVVKGNYLEDKMKVESFCLDFSSGFHFKIMPDDGKPFESLVLEPEERENIDENIYNYVEIKKTGTQEEAAEYFEKSQSTISRAVTRHKDVLLKRKE
jgi:archaellum biogenesis ATPase FlaH|tara:strand:- start:346 stop:1359 length:1014 start_codon:yes stop_codon:yes gene_type:complete